MPPRLSPATSTWGCVPGCLVPGSIVATRCSWRCAKERCKMRCSVLMTHHRSAQVLQGMSRDKNRLGRFLSSHQLPRRCVWLAVVPPTHVSRNVPDADALILCAARGTPRPQRAEGALDGALSPNRPDHEERPSACPAYPCQAASALVGNSPPHPHRRRPRPHHPPGLLHHSCPRRPTNH